VWKVLVIGVVHDSLCFMNVDPLIAECLVCDALAAARVQERSSMEGVSAFEVGGLAYARGREEAADAVREYRVVTIPMFPGDTPLGLAERVKGLLVSAALGVWVNPTKDS
jgi:hypothetical protein